MRFDCDITASEIQQLAGADAVAALFAKLGYRTDVRVPQTPANLGITADGTVRPIKRVELIADQEGLLQVYLFELTTVTVTHTRALARAFRNRAGNYLLVLTSDYDRLDFVLVEKYLPSPAAAPTTITQAQVGVRPRMLTVERRKPGRVELRVLRRFTYTESDPLAQYDKMLSAYAIADWSEEFFNNRALFSDYYLLERLRDRPEWAEDPKPAYAALQELYRGASSRLANQPEDRLRADLLEPVFKTLGFAAKTGKKSASAAEEPDYRLFGPEAKDKPLALCLAYPWGRSLDGKDPEHDKETPEENPNFVVVSALEKGEAQWAVVTNGKVWRLYSARAHSRATNYYEIDLEEALSPAGPQGGSPAESFRYFWLLFRRQALEPTTVSREGREQTLSFLDLLLAESEDYAKELGERLKERVFKQVFPHLAEGFIASIRKRDGKEADLSQPALDKVFQGTLTLLYRLLFLLYAESRDLLPAKEVRGYFEASLTKLKREMAEAAGTIADEVEGKLRKAYRDDSYALYDRLARLFAVVDRGDPALNVPVYNGGLFLTRPEKDDDSPEAHAARFLNTTKVSDRDLACALNHLVRDEDPKRHDLVFIDFKSLGVRQLGSIYEGLLEFKVRIASHKLAVTKEKGREVYVPFADLDEREQARAERADNVVKKGAVYLENDNHERKATGSYYTPDPIVKYIVEHVVGPVLEEKFEKVRPLLRKAQTDRAAFFKQQEAFRKQGMRPKPDAQADLLGRDVVNELFDLKVLDLAMGSGHFLVEAVDFITDRTLTFLAAFPWNPVLAHLGRMRETILAEMDEQGIAIDPKRLTDVNLLKRQVLKRCIYGVDLNPMAVELAKVSLWLDCFTLGAPLSFLDHHLRCGNSLIGVTVQEVRDAVGQVLWGDQFAGLMLGSGLMRHVGELSDVTSAQVHESRAEYAKAQDALAPFKRILDVYASRWFGNEPQQKGRKRSGSGGGFDPAVEFLATVECTAWAKDPSATKGLTDWDKKVVARTLAAAEEKRFFHWELEFPEVFYGPSRGSAQKIERLDGGGFDAIVGNPPYVRPHKLSGADKRFFWAVFTTFVKKSDLYCCFVERGSRLLAESGRLGMILSDGYLRLDSFADLRRFLLNHGTIDVLVDFTGPVFKDAAVLASILVCSRRPCPAGHMIQTAYADPNAILASLVMRPIAQASFNDTYKQMFDISLTPSVGKAKQDICRDTVTIGSVFDVQFGLKTGDDAKFLTFSPTTPKHKKLLRGEDVHRYRSEFSGEYVWYVPKEMRKHRATARPGEPERFEQPKILVRDTGGGLEATYDGERYYVKDVLIALHPLQSEPHLKALTGILNSSVLRAFYEASFPTLHVQTEELSSLPIPCCLADEGANVEVRRIAELVDKVLHLRRLLTAMPNSPKALHAAEEAVRIERDIDECVLQLYGVDSESLATLEEAAKHCRPHKREDADEDDE